MNEEVTRVSQDFGVLTIGFSSCASGGRSADGLRNQSQELLIDMMARCVDVLSNFTRPADGLFWSESCWLVYRYGVVLISWNGVVLECFLAIAILVVPVDIHERKEEVALPEILFSSEYPCGNLESSTCVTLNGSGIQLAVGPQPLRLRNHNSGLAQRIMVKRLVTSPHDPLGITDSASKNQSVVVSVQYGPFNPYISIRSTTIGKSRVAIDPIAMHTSWRSNSDIASVTSIGYPHMSASGESSTTMQRLLHASGSHQSRRLMTPSAPGNQAGPSGSSAGRSPHP
ncbi:hypothetical protein F511_15694 [Dorcoceras hygrometricum]|uniref:Uncharacterized protein n=1 Tax=Dorcoceras hygrometricum TaxID=472368 RepID=A0A2Z7BKV2_9LAMI|nr:hypothetical protein F511_15694 [Dorcoceras hygrometricum]